MAQGFVRQAGEPDGAALEISKALIGVTGGGRAAETGHAQLLAFLGVHHGGHAGRDAQQRKLRMPGVRHFQRIETEKHPVFLQFGQRTLFRLHAGLGEELDQGVHIRLAGDVHGGLPDGAQQLLLQGRVDDMRVIAVAQQGFADGDGFFERLMHRGLLAKDGHSVVLAAGQAAKRAEEQWRCNGREATPVGILSENPGGSWRERLPLCRYTRGSRVKCAGVASSDTCRKPVKDCAPP